MTNLHKWLPACGFVIAVALVCITSSFKDASKTKAGPYFYKYTSSNYSPTEIQKIDNYKRSDDDGCPGDTDVCGVLLPSDEGVNNPPVSAEFASESSNLVNSEANHAPANSNIIMQN